MKTAHCWEENCQGQSGCFYGPHDGQVGHVLDPLEAEDVKSLEDGEGGEGTSGGHVDGGPKEDGDGHDTVVWQLAKPYPGEILVNCRDVLNLRRNVARTIQVMASMVWEKKIEEPARAVIMPSILSLEEYINGWSWLDRWQDSWLVSCLDSWLDSWLDG